MRVQPGNFPALVFILLFAKISAQDYDVSEIQCTFNGGLAIGGANEARQGKALGKDSISARLRKPEGFKGAPLFADDRGTDPLLDAECQIRPDPEDLTGLAYNLLVTNFGRCGVLRRNGFVHVRVWFPQFPGVVMMSDQELIIMCKPPEPTIIENKAAGFAGSLPHGARVSGVVEETPGRLEYEVALYKEAPPRLSTATSAATAGVSGGGGELPVDQAVPIGTKLQLRARINPQSAWKHVKLMEVTVSPDPDDAHVDGSVPLVKGGCRNRDLATIIPHQPARYRDRPNEVFLDFEAFLLSSMKERSTLWIHSQIKACMDAVDCQPEYCLDLFEPSGQGRKRRAVAANMPSGGGGIQPFRNNTQYTKFQENIEYTVLMPGDLYRESDAADSSCNTFLVVSGTLGCLLAISAILMCYLASRLQAAVATSSQRLSIDQLVREHSLKHPEAMSYTGRSVLQ